MSPSYKLFYFDFPGRGELIRLIFHQAGVEFEDVRFAREQWPSMKPEMPFGQVPVLAVDGKKLSQSHAIARYVATKYGLAGNDDWDSAVCDQMADAIVDLMQPYFVWKYFGKSDAEKEEAKKKLYETLLPPFCERMAAAMKNNPSGWLICDKLTWADIYLAYIVETLDKSEPGYLEKYPDVLAHQKKVFEEPNLKAYLEKRG